MFMPGGLISGLEGAVKFLSTRMRKGKQDHA